MVKDWVSLAEAAAELEVAPRTVRRWIHCQKLPAELRPGSHGPQYVLPVESVRRLRNSRAALQPAPRWTIDDVVAVLAPYLDARDRALLEQQRALLDELRCAREQLEQLCADLWQADRVLQQIGADLAERQRAMWELHDALAIHQATVRATGAGHHREERGRTPAGG